MKKRVVAFIAFSFLFLAVSCSAFELTDKSVSEITGLTLEESKQVISVLENNGLDNITSFTSDDKNESYTIVNNASQYSFTIKNGVVDLIVDSSARTIYRNIENLPMPTTASEIVDYIAIRAKEDAKTVTSEEIKKYLDYIFQNKSNLFANNNVMEHIMYYGCIFDHSCRADLPELAKLGWDCYKVVKDVYRGYEEIDSEFTKSVLDDIENDINELVKAMQ